jgi:ATP-dependent RNA helicase RhlE
MLSHMIGSGNWQQVLVFTRTKHGANRLAQQLERDGLSAAAIHGNKSQGARTRALAGFKNGKIRVLVATDIAARGLDINQLPHVVNYELPNVPEDYVHRIGRTGRAGNEGEAISLVCVDEQKLLKDIERLLKGRIPQVIVEGYEADPNITPEPIRKQRNTNPRNKNRNPDGAKSRSRSRKKVANGKSQQPAQQASNQDQHKAKNSRKHNRVKQATEHPQKPRRHSAGKRKKETAALLGG